MLAVTSIQITMTKLTVALGVESRIDTHLRLAALTYNFSSFLKCYSLLCSQNYLHSGAAEEGRLRGFWSCFRCF